MSHEAERRSQFRRREETCTPGTSVPSRTTKEKLLVHQRLNKAQHLSPSQLGKFPTSFFPVAI